MAELQLIIDGASIDDDDAYVITSLAQEWGSRLLDIAELKLFKDGRRWWTRAVFRRVLTRTRLPFTTDAPVGCRESRTSYQRECDRPAAT